ncbi:hypothetical protein B5K08_18650 [Rhizobium leguminosarum bv. trifolii]|uniref:Uncharacterized protein n=1 Tax=Rhizobium leguminosarum bv. trifolii TaxID=386 RepID=A0A3E1BI55_RHILT|nr:MULTISPECIES: hypothetical protein [Rhizobium]ANM11973.1 hypothetical protein AMK05_CH03616 [Rhizobium sp. N324]ANM18465.1 hypothetical protein AMK06_CH03592 [Rhizobium sp. N541]ANM24851.1 hypothetical protein AMK07_CH03590 [Rhizobium sp. N941]OYD05578.1 hypothetical protein AMK08_CH103635 [Rhizobium sp. N4311]RFB89998.1 hypothetical protein B5K08_18650 [Rhizobium leguminosarum bv. trifolii]
MLKSALIVVAVSIAAGATIRASAFAIFTFLLILAWGAMILLKGSSFSEAIVYCLEALVLMEVSYLAGLFAYSLWGHIQRRRRKNSITERSHVTGKRPHG